ELYQISIHFPAFQHLSSPLSILPYLSEKAQLQPDFFDTLSGTEQTLCAAVFCFLRNRSSAEKGTGAQ
ncbi:hypothetical protein, partial [Dysosmobacter sp.]|uniref:hypothetical protein n=1 Tax=Dysosmobacter sp. TaxID=2591382 RepID=UPI003AB852CE